MDVAPIVAALVAGAAEVGKTVVKDAYEGLKALLAAKLKGHADGEMALARFAEKPANWQGLLADALEERKAGEDPAVADAVAALEKALAGASVAGERSVTAGSINGSVVVTGDRNRVIQRKGN